ncbi:Abi family protein [Lactiplantibacillus pentosus]|uniref:Abi family protein n=1 Tax=Lactiplantibacillus pentosus TaxID=1589 RepID=UPI001C1FAE54|nr:Abi family protein [Lactiplantibacillus pentosus]MBU7481162.1 Abi family protein [Lactiplantibacillus pentosus]
MGVKPWKSRHELAVTLATERHLNADSIAVIEQHLQETNYFQLVNGIENLLLAHPETHPKQFTTETFDDFLRIYKFDVRLKDEIFNLIEHFEGRLKTAIAYNFSKNHCQYLNATMQYTNKNNYYNVGLNSQYPFRERGSQYYSICQNFDNFNLFTNHFIEKLIRNNDFIDTRFYRDVNYSNPNGVAYYNRDRHVAIPFWVAIETVDFGTLLRIMHYLKSNDARDVLADFGLGNDDNYKFLSALDVIRSLRNECAHGSLILRFKTPKYIKLNANLVHDLELKPDQYGSSGNNYPAIIHLADALKVLGSFQSLKSLRPILKALIYQNNKYFNSTNYDLNDRILKRMGIDSYKELKAICV